MNLQCPWKTVELRMKNYDIEQQLHDDGIIDDKEFAEQKQSILTLIQQVLMCLNTTEEKDLLAICIN